MACLGPAVLVSQSPIFPSKTICHVKLNTFPKNRKNDPLAQFKKTLNINLATK